MAEATIQERTNQGLVDLNRRKDKKGKRKKGNVANANARVLNQELLDDDATTKAWDEEWSFQIRIRPNVFEESRAAMKRRQTALASLSASTILSPQKTLQKVQQSQKAQPCGVRTDRAPQRSARLIVRVRVRVTTQELEQGRWAMKIGVGSLEGKDLVEDLEQIQAMGRGQRIRRPRRAS